MGGDGAGRLDEAWINRVFEERLPTRIDLPGPPPSEGKLIEWPTEVAALYVPSAPGPFFFTTGHEPDTELPPPRH